MKTVAAARCMLESLVEAHASEMFRILSDPAIDEFENEPPRSERELAARYQRLETRSSVDGQEQWLNWVVRLPTRAFARYLQATVLPSRTGFVAYELNSEHWRQGIGSSAVGAMLSELCRTYGVETFLAVLKAKNFRSEALLRSLGFDRASEAQQLQHRDEPDELVMVSVVGTAQRAA